MKKRLQESEREINENKRIALELDSAKGESQRLIREIKVLKKEISIIKEEQEIEQRKYLQKLDLKGKNKSENIF